MVSARLDYRSSDQRRPHDAGRIDRQRQLTTNQNLKVAVNTRVASESRVDEIARALFGAWGVHMALWQAGGSVGGAMGIRTPDLLLAKAFGAASIRCTRSGTGTTACGVDW